MDKNLCLYQNVSDASVSCAARLLGFSHLSESFSDIIWTKDSWALKKWDGGIATLVTLYSCALNNLVVADANSVSSYCWRLPQSSEIRFKTEFWSLGSCPDYHRSNALKNEDRVMSGRFCCFISFRSRPQILCLLQFKRTTGIRLLMCNFSAIENSVGNLIAHLKKLPKATLGSFHSALRILATPPGAFQYKTVISLVMKHNPSGTEDPWIPEC